MVDALLLLLMMPTGKQNGGAPPASVWHGFSGHWMAFYSAGLAIVTSAYRRGFSNLSPRCAHGHAVAYDDRFCPTCGTPLDRTPNPVDRAVNA